MPAMTNTHITNGVDMARRGANPAPQVTARSAAVLYLLIAVLSGFVHVPGKLLVSGDATTTATNILANQGLFRLSIAFELIILLSEVILSVLLYVLLRPVSPTLSLVAAVSRLTMTTIHGINVLNNLIVLLIVSGAGYVTGFVPTQR